MVAGTPSDLIQRLAAAIFRQEGSQLPTNPGNLRDCPWFPVLKQAGWPDGYPRRVYYDSTLVQRIQLDGSGWFWQPRTLAEGVAGAMHVIALHIAEGNNLEQLISIWAPASDSNNTRAYISNVSTWADIPDTGVLWTLL